MAKLRGMDKKILGLIKNKLLRLNIGSVSESGNVVSYKLFDSDGISSWAEVHLPQWLGAKGWVPKAAVVAAFGLIDDRLIPLMEAKAPVVGASGRVTIANTEGVYRGLEMMCSACDQFIKTTALPILVERKVLEEVKDEARAARLARVAVELLK